MDPSDRPNSPPSTPGTRLDLSSEPPNPTSSPPSSPPPSGHIGIHFTCCHVYTHLRPPSGRDHWWAHCPRCGARLRVEIAADGDGDRFIQVG